MGLGGEGKEGRGREGGGGGVRKLVQALVYDIMSFPQKVPESNVSLQCGPASMSVPQFVATGQGTGISTLESNRKIKLTEPLATPSVS